MKPSQAPVAGTIRYSPPSGEDARPDNGAAGFISGPTLSPPTAPQGAVSHVRRIFPRLMATKTGLRAASGRNWASPGAVGKATPDATRHRPTAAAPATGGWDAGSVTGSRCSESPLARNVMRAILASASGECRKPPGRHVATPAIKFQNGITTHPSTVGIKSMSHRRQA